MKILIISTLIACFPGVCSRLAAASPASEHAAENQIAVYQLRVTPTGTAGPVALKVHIHNRGPLRLISIEYRRGRESFIIRQRNASNRKAGNLRVSRKKIVMNKSKKTKPRIIGGPRGRMNFVRAAAACEFQSGRLPSLREARSFFSKSAKVGRGRLRSVWTATAFHNSDKAVWLYHPRKRTARGTLKSKQADVVCMARRPMLRPESPGR